MMLTKHVAEKKDTLTGLYTEILPSMEKRGGGGGQKLTIVLYEARGGVLHPTPAMLACLKSL